MLHFVLYDVAFAFLDLHLVAVRDLLAYPSGHVLGRGIHVHYVVQELVIEPAVDQLLDAREIDHHAVLVECFGLAVDRDNPVVAVQAAALAFVGERELVRSRYFHALDDPVHDYAPYSVVSVMPASASAAIRSMHVAHLPQWTCPPL